MAQTHSDPEVLLTLDEGFAVVRVPFERIREQDKNARIMPPAMQRSLSDNIRKDGHLESLPLAHVLQSGDYELISGHHRVRAARQAGLSDVVMLAYLSELPKSQVRAKQLAHNSHEGFDDPATLRELYLEIDSPDDRLSTFLDPEKLNIDTAADAVKITDISVPFKWHYVSFAFLPYQADAFERLCERMKADEDTLYVMPETLFEAFKECARRVGLTEDIRNVGTVVARMIELTNAVLDERENDGREGH